MLLNLFLEVRVGREDRFDLIVSRLGAFVSIGFFLQEVVWCDFSVIFIV